MTKKITFDALPPETVIYKVAGMIKNKWYFYAKVGMRLDGHCHRSVSGYVKTKAAAVAKVRETYPGLIASAQADRQALVAQLAILDATLELHS